MTWKQRLSKYGFPSAVLLAWLFALWMFFGPNPAPPPVAEERCWNEGTVKHYREMTETIKRNRCKYKYGPRLKDCMTFEWLKTTCPTYVKLKRTWIENGICRTCESRKERSS